MIRLPVLPFTFFFSPFQEHSGRVFRLQFDEFQIVSSSHDDTILIWDFLNVPFDGVASNAVTNGGGGGGGGSDRGGGSGRGNGSGGGGGGGGGPDVGLGFEGGRSGSGNAGSRSSSAGPGVLAGSFPYVSGSGPRN